MNGVVKPHAMPTKRKPIVQRKMDGGDVRSVGMSVFIMGLCDYEEV